MKPQLSSPSCRGLFFALFFALLLFAQPVWSAPPPSACTSGNMPTGTAAYVAATNGASAAGFVFVVDTSSNQIACFITVGKNPTNLAVSPDSTQLLVENDADGTVTVVSLADGSIVGTVTLTGVTAPMTANLAISPDNSFAYVVSLPATITPGTTTPNLSKIVLPVPAGNSSAPLVAGGPLSTAVNAPGLGIAFTPDGSHALITTEGETYQVATSSDTVSSSSAASGGTAVVLPSAASAYVIDVIANPATITQIPGSTQTPFPQCSTANASAITPDSSSLYYTCPGSNFVQVVPAATNTCGGSGCATIMLAPTSTGPQGITIPSDGSSAYVANSDGSISVIDIGSNTVTAHFAVPGTPPPPLGGIGSRPPAIVLTNPAPPTNTLNVPINASFPFAAVVKYARRAATITWSVNCTAGGAACGTIDPTTGVYRAPTVPPAPPTVTVSALAASTVAPNEFLNANFDRVSVTVTVTPTAISVSLLPASPAVPIGMPDVITATILNDGTNQGVNNWAVNGTVGGSAAAGFIVATSTTTATYTAPSVLPPAPSMVTISATSVADNTQTATTTVTVLPGAAATLVVTGYLSPATAGTSNTFTVTAKDGVGDVATGYLGTIRFTSSDPQAVLPANYTFVAGDAGVHTFNATLKTAGTQSITATDTVTATITGAQTGITINAAAATSLTVAGYLTPVVAGTSNNFTVTAKDPFGNVANSYLGTIHFTSSDAQAVLPANYTFVAGDAGVHVFSATLKTAATQFITATDTVVAGITGTQTGIVVNAGAAATFVVTGYLSPVTAGTSNPFTVTAKDSLGNIATGYLGTVHFTSTDAQAVLPANYAFVAGDAGAHAFSATLKTAATQSITATDTVTVAVTGTQAGITVNAAAASKLAFAQQPTTTTAGVAIAPAVTVQVEDPFGNVVKTDASNVTVNISAGGVLSATSVTTVAASAGVATFAAIIPTKSGTFTLSATDGALTGTASNNFNVVAAAPTKLVFPNPAAMPTAGVCSAAITIQSQDQFGNPSNVATATTVNLVTTSTGTSAFSASPTCSPATTSTIIAANQNSANFFYSDTKAATPTITASAGGLTSAAQQETVSPAQASKLIFATQPVSGALGGNQTPLAPVVLNVEDSFGNVVGTDTSNVAVTISTGGAFSAASTITVPAVAGIATFSRLFPTIAGTFTLSATDGTLTAATSTPFTLTSTIVVNITSAFTSVKIEDLPAGTNTFTATATNDPSVPSLGVTWLMVSCGGVPVNTNALTACGQVATNGAYTPPARVPLAPANIFIAQATANADQTKITPTPAITITSAIHLTMANIAALIGANVDFTPKTAGGNVNLGAGANQSDLSLGVTLAITGTCVAPPNYTFSGNDGLGCGSFSGSQTASPPTYAYTAPAVVPMAASCATIPASCLGTQNKASIKVTATSVADPNQPPASTTFVITSNISFGILLMADAVTMKNICNPYIYSATDPNILAELASDPCGFKGWPANNSLNPPGPNLAVGYGAALAQANIQGFGSVTGLTWTPTASFAPASGIQSAFTAPQTVPTGGNVAITAYAIADFTSKATLAMPIVGSKLIPDSIVAPFTLTVPSGKSTGSIALDLLGPASGTINFTCPAAGFVNLTQTTCAFSPNPASATGTTVVTMTLNVTRSSVMPTRPPLTPLPPMPGLPIAVLSILSLLLLVLSYATREWTRLHWAPAYRWSNAFALLILCALVLTWAGACGQFSQPSTVPPPPIPPTQPASGAATAAATPSLDASPATNSLIVPSTVVQ